ncbi:MAG: hypothetical protein HZB38_11620 [Planctomycetes bacterium]|nr:hypothetical protein [Planctomycetota bacterium]
MSRPIIFSALCLFGALSTLAAAQPSPLDAYNVVWESPSHDAAGSMPIGNGVVGLNVWAEEDGDLLFYIARTDSWSECERLLKLGRVRVSLSPNPFAKGQPFRQELRLREGRISITAGAAASKVELSLHVDANTPTIFLQGTAATPVDVRVTAENWRTERRRITEPDELRSSWTMHSAPADVAVWESADVFLEPQSAGENAVTWYHRNEDSIVPLTIKHQGLTEVASSLRDTLLHRTFGGRIESRQMRKLDSRTLAGEKLNRFEVQIATHCAQVPAIADWISQINQLGRQTADAKASAEATAEWWLAFWDRSWIYAAEPASATSMPQRADGAAAKYSDPQPPSRITQAYILQRWMLACASRGDFPPKFNGSIFTVEPRFTERQTYNADWRKWGGCFWWQNTRLPYYPMLAAGDFDLMSPLFSLYERVTPACVARSGLYHNTKGAYFPETMTTFGAYSNGDYGWKRDGVDRSVVQCPWWQWAWQQSLELSQLMLDYAAYTGDRKFLETRALPMAREALLYFDSRFQRDAGGKLVISPTQAIETYWHDVVNDAPTVAGLRCVCDQLLALPADLGTPEDRALWSRVSQACPPLPLMKIDGVDVAAPAEKFDSKRSNCETPELYPLWPFRLYGIGRPNLAAASEAYKRRQDRSNVGWTQDGMFAAALGLADEAAANLLAKSRNSHPNFRFPAMWGPNFDWLPDQDHGSNLMTVLQMMLLQADREKIYVLPAWPRTWDVSFRLHAPQQTTVECTLRGGKLEKLIVTPERRRADVVLAE